MLTSNPHETEELDLLELHLMSTKINAEYAIKKLTEKDTPLTDEEKADVALAHDALEAAGVALGRHVKDGTTPTALIGFIPTRKLSNLRHRYGILQRDKFDVEKATLEQREEFDEIARLYLRWGIKGHSNLGVTYETESEQCGPRTVHVASWEMVDVYEGLNLLYLMYQKVREYNTLAEIKKKESTLSVGTTPQNSTAKSADSSQH